MAAHPNLHSPLPTSTPSDQPFFIPHPLVPRLRVPRHSRSLHVAMPPQPIPPYTDGEHWARALCSSDREVQATIIQRAAMVTGRLPPPVTCHPD